MFTHVLALFASVAERLQYLLGVVECWFGNLLQVCYRINFLGVHGTYDSLFVLKVSLNKH